MNTKWLKFNRTTNLPKLRCMNDVVTPWSWRLFEDNDFDISNRMNESALDVFVQILHFLLHGFQNLLALDCLVKTSLINDVGHWDFSPAASYLSILLVDERIECCLAFHHFFSLYYRELLRQNWVMDDSGTKDAGEWLSNKKYWYATFDWATNNLCLFYRLHASSKLDISTQQQLTTACS